MSKKPSGMLQVNCFSNFATKECRNSAVECETGDIDVSEAGTTRQALGHTSGQSLAARTRIGMVLIQPKTDRMALSPRQKKPSGIPICLFNRNTRRSCDRPKRVEMTVDQIRIGRYGIEERNFPKSKTPPREKTAPTTLIVPMKEELKCKVSV